MSEKKPCGCGNKKISTDLPAEKPVNNVTFTDSPAEKSVIKKTIGKIQGYAMAMASRGFKDKRVEKTVKQLRVLSCFGNQDQGGQLPPCSHLKKSETDGKFFCGACGCGDRRATWLNGTDEEYSKLDYPKVNCPISMPGFTNYIPSQPNEANEPQTRKYYMENMKFMDIQKVKVSAPPIPKEIEDIFEALQNIQDSKDTPK